MFSIPKPKKILFNYQKKKNYLHVKQVISQHVLLMLKTNGETQDKQSVLWSPLL